MLVDARYGDRVIDADGCDAMDYMTDTSRYGPLMYDPMSV